MTLRLLKALTNMYEKPFATNKAHIMHKLNLKMLKNACTTDHINEFIIVITRLSSVEIVFDKEVKALILPSSSLDISNKIVTATSSCSGSWKLKYNVVCDLILSKDVCKRESSLSTTPATLNVEVHNRLEC